jgi:hypothetical protein
MKRQFIIGESDFRNFIGEGYYFIDKSLLVKDIINDNSRVLLLPRPRRFGKTLNLSMLRYFFEKTGEDRSFLFNGLAIKKEKELFHRHQGQYPVIYLTFKDMVFASFEAMAREIKSIVAYEFSRFEFLLNSMENKKERDYFKAVLAEAQPIEFYQKSLKVLSEVLERHYRQKVMILIDEYDTPIHTAYTYGFYDEMIVFMRNFMSAAFKDNNALFKGVITGILRVSKESIFSGLNNLGVYTVLNRRFSDKFGITETELEKVCVDFECKEDLPGIRDWYNGYRFGDTIIYNPWSITYYISNREDGFRPYWVNTSSNELLYELIVNSPMSVKNDIEKLLKKEPVRKKLNEEVVLRDVKRDYENVFSFLFFSGYLTWSDVSHINDENYYDLKIPNKEVALTFRNIIQKWFNSGVDNRELEVMLRALTEGDIRLFEKLFSKFVVETLSYFDINKKNEESVYQAFTLGLLANLSHSHEINSNKESGYGRYDISIIPKDKSKPGIIMELKSIDPFENETKEVALEKAVSQIVQRKYKTELEKRGITNIIQMGVVFDGKRVWVKQAE